MEKVLSQEEVDSLLNGIDEGKVETETDIPVGDEGLQAYNFSDKSGPYHHRMPALGIINERFISFINTSLSNATGVGIDVSVNEIESVKYGEFCRSLPLPASLNIFKMEPLRGFFLLVLEGPLVFSFVDTFFGGKCSTHVKLEGRSFTTIETKIIERIVNITLQDLQKAWADVYEVTMKYSRSEVDPQFAGIAKPEDMIVNTKFNVDIGNFSGALTLCMPFASIERIKDKLSENFKSEKMEVDSAWRRAIEEILKEICVDLTCTLGNAKITSKELLDMKTDDVIVLDSKIDDPININIGKNKKILGYPGSFNNRKAVRIKKWINTE
jgi:flagellar motor switch protein FliM